MLLIGNYNVNANELTIVYTNNTNGNLENCV